jgi:predicted acyltransferase
MSDSSQNRLISLDVFRGMTIAGMVLVNNPGTWSHIYDPLEHAPWHGLTPTDWIFPFFLFIVGVAIPIALGKYLGGNPTGREGVSRAGIYRKILTRAAMIFALGLTMSAIPFFQFAATDAPDSLKMLIWLAMAAGLLFLLLRNFKVAGILIGLGIVGVIAMNLGGYNVVPYNVATMRIPGVLQRIALCYLIVSLIFLHTNWKQQLGIAVALLLGYWLLMTQIAVPGCDVTTIDDKACNLAAYIDRMILGEHHIWRSAKVFDPEGILSTLPAIATTISGVLAGLWLRSEPPALAGGKNATENSTSEVEADVDRATASTPPAHAGGSDKVAGLFFFGTILLAIGYIWNIYFPMNKSLWTSSYVLVTSGIALLTLAACYWLIDIKGYKRWAKPFVIFGVNALPLFVFSGIMARMLGAYRVTGVDGQSVAVQKWIFDNIYLSIAQPVDASLMYAISFILVWLFLMWLLYRKRIFVRV